jgi:DNA-binding GntR family transcriptional regulator
LSAVKPRSLVSQVHDAISRRIAAGGLPPGTALNIAELAKSFGVSPTPVREALARLAAEGALGFTDNIGYRVAPLPSAADYTDWAVARLVVESNALRFVLGPIDPRILDEAEAINRGLGEASFGDDAEGVRRYSEANWAFHGRLIALARNPLLDDIHARLYRAPQFSRIFLGRGIPDRARVVAEHRRILTALRRGDREAAARALSTHIVDSLERDARLVDAAVSLKRLVRDRRADHRT